ncbi:uncharacterized protein LOC110942580 [Helianthus annuus]|uniref:uncharacterized protein LOC110942580 n=1 Tax=Helianthus annuus TaxID=4232 RepID=UPI000B902082|nr:uncharacterized protein LOC110942580 [Helianthus annuus]
MSSNGSWLWPNAWRDTYPVLIQLDQVQRDVNVQDRLFWKDGDDFSDYSSSGVWNSIRASEPEVDWASIVWFAQCIPHHAFVMWLIMRRKLTTQDKILQWNTTRRNSMNMMCCLLCYENIDSHDHLFFECKFSTQVWKTIRTKAGMGNVEAKWSVIVEWLQLRARSKSAANLVCRLIVAASAYVIWQERNHHLFKNHASPPENICASIFDIVRYKLMGLKFKNTPKVRILLEKWEIHGDSVVDDGG